MTKPRTLTESFETIHSARPLYVIAKEHADSRVLSTPTRAVFDDIAGGKPLSDFECVDTVHAAFFEAAASASTRLGQSYSRRIMLGDLNRLRQAVLSGQPVPRERTYVIGLPCTVTVNTDGTVDVWLDVTEAADIESESFDYSVVKADAEVIANAVDNGAVTVTSNGNLAR